MPRSTGKFISYDLRPSKQTERLIIVDILKAASNSGLPITDYRYIGMGANRFYDFLLVHRYLNITRMISLEHDEEFFERARFNAPFSFINVQNTSTADFISNDQSDEPSIFWLDYDGGIGPNIVGDVASLAAKAKLGDFVFVTVSGNPPRVIDRLNGNDRLAWLQDNLGDVAGGIELADVEKSTFPDAVHKILCAAFKNAYSARRDGEFVALLQVEYSDSMPMVTMGGAFLSDGQASPLRKKVGKTLPFLPNGDRMYDIRSLHITERERALLDKAVTSKRQRTAEKNKLMAMGFKESDISAYKDLLRYLPRYVESIV